MLHAWSDQLNTRQQPSSSCYNLRENEYELGIIGRLDENRIREEIIVGILARSNWIVDT